MGNVYKIQSVASGKVLDVPGGNLDNGTVIQQYQDRGGTNQKWELIFVGVILGNNAYKIVSLASHLVLDVPNGNTNDGVEIQQYQDHNGMNQFWYQIPVGDNSYKLQSVSSQKVLDVPNASHDNEVPIQQYHDLNGANQHWYFIEVNPE